MVWIMLVKLMYNVHPDIDPYAKKYANSEQLKNHRVSIFVDLMKKKTFSAFRQNWKVTQHACSMFHVRCSHHANFIADTWKIIWQRIGANIWQTFNVSDESALHSTELEPSRAQPSWITAINASYVFRRCLANCLIIQQICSSLSYVDRCWLWNIVYNMYLFALERFNDYAFA